jgi:hypothetical protein
VYIILELSIYTLKNEAQEGKNKSFLFLGVGIRGRGEGIRKR